MKKISKRKIVAIAGVLGATAAIGVPAAVVYALKDASTKTEIGMNVERELENKILDSIKLMPVGQSHILETNRIQDHINNLTERKENVDDLTSQFNIRARSRLPIYGIINDTLNVSERFNDWKEFTNVIKLIVNDLNSENWDSLSEHLFDTSNGGANKIFSKSYGIKKEELADGTSAEKDGTETDTEKQELERKDFGLKNSFVSFGSFIEDFKGNIDPKIKEAHISTIIAALNMMTGTQIVKDSSGYSIDLDSKTPPNSIVYMALWLKQSADDNAKKLSDIWTNQFLVAWNERYNGIDQFYNVNHQPISDASGFLDSKSLRTYRIYDEKLASSDSTGEIQKTMESFLDGTKMAGEVPDFSAPAKTNAFKLTESGFKGSTDRYLSNWHFLEALFGNPFNEMVSAKTGEATPSPIVKGFNWDVAISNNSVDIIGNSGKTLIPAKQYFKNALMNIFETQKLSKIVKRPSATPGSKDLKITNVPGNIIDLLTDDRDFQDSYDELIQATKAYENELESIKMDSFRIGIDLDKFQNVIKSFNLNDEWSIRINSLLGRKISAKNIGKIKDKLKYKNDGISLMTQTPDYDIVGNFIYPNSPEWLLRPTDSISISDFKFNDGAKLKQFEPEMKRVRLFKPEFIVDQNEDTTNLSINWNVIETVDKGDLDD